MVRILATIATLFLLAPVLAAQPAAITTQPEAPEELLPGAEAFFDGAVGALLDVHDIPGVTLSVVKDGRVILAKGYGFADVARTRPIDPARTLFRPGSISKTFTWTAVMQLVEDGQLDLDTDVNRYLTQFQIPATYDQPITLRHILTHTAGFEDGAVGYLFRRDKTRLQGLAAALEAYMPARVRPPGELSSYSNWATALAGLIVANVSDLPFDSYVEKHIFGPLGMTRSSFREPLPDALADQMSGGFYRVGGDYRDGGFEYVHDFGPAGGLSTTATDMARFMLAHLGEGELDAQRILQTETAERMRERLFGHHPALPGMAYGFYQIRHNGRTGYGHGGDTVHFHSEMFLLPEEELGIFVSTNAPSGAVAVRQIVPAFMDRYFPAPADPHPAPEQPETLVADADLAEFIGAYRTIRRSYSKWEKVLALGGDTQVSPSPHGGLLVGGKHRYVRHQGDVFRNVDSPDDLIAFGRDEAGRVTAFYNRFPAIASIKQSPLTAASSHLAVFGVSALVALGVVIGSLWAIGKWWRMTGGEKLARLVLFAAAGTILLFWAHILLVVIAQGQTAQEIVFTGIPGLKTLLTWPLLSGLATVLAIGLAVRAWRRGYWSLWGRLRYSAVTLLFALTVWLFQFWNLLGPWNA